jgi:hypothetical protein
MKKISEKIPKLLAPHFLDLFELQNISMTRLFFASKNDILISLPFKIRLPKRF